MMLSNETKQHIKKLTNDRNKAIVKKLTLIVLLLVVHLLWEFENYYNRLLRSTFSFFIVGN